ncbi:MAG: lipopolysaccharide biosynthesis protein [Flavipsychrobacter sp.]|nr:lipopolysaccharide biosynthesis protein [Flavipsychrobacter sp.]
MLFGNGVQMVVGFATSFILFHYLTLAEAGTWYFMQSFVGLCEAARYGFLATATVKFYAGTAVKRAANVLGSVWVLAILLTSIVLVANAVALAYLPYTTNTELIVCIKWIGLTFLSSLPADVAFWRMQANEKYGTMFLFRLLNSLSSLVAFSVLIYLHKFSLENALLFNFLSNCFSSAVAIVFNLSGIKDIMHRSKETISEIFHFGKYTFGTTMFSSMLGSSDTWIINFILGPAAVAIYNLAMRFMGLIDLPLRTFVTTGMSEMAIAYNAGKMAEVTQLFKKYAGMLTIVFIPFNILAFIGGVIAIKFMGGHRYDGEPLMEAINAYGMILILAITFPIDRFNGLALDIIHKTKTNFQKVIIMLVVKTIAGLILTLVFKHIFGIVIANYLMTIAAIWFGYHHLNRYMPHTITGIIVTGYNELRDFIRKELKLTSKPKGVS